MVRLPSKLARPRSVGMGWEGKGRPERTPQTFEKAQKRAGECKDAAELREKAHREPKDKSHGLFQLPFNNDTVQDLSNSGETVRDIQEVCDGLHVFDISATCFVLLRETVIAPFMTLVYSILFDACLAQGQLVCLSFHFVRVEFIFVPSDERK